MTKKTRTESKMLEQVRRWRREVYEADQGRTGSASATERLRELGAQFGLATGRRDERVSAANRQYP